MFNLLKNHIINIPGWRTNRKIVVFESDDWGSIRIPSKNVQNQLRKNGIKVDNCAYMLNDNLESNEDLEAIFNLLSSKKKSPIITANFLTANPDFEKIGNDKFEIYHHESIYETSKKYPLHDRVYEYWLKAIQEGYFQPQLHGREHLNVNRWMNDLVKGNRETKLAFDVEVFGVSAHVVKYKRGSYQAAFDLSDNHKYATHSQIIDDAVEEFKVLFGYSPITFIAPNYVWGQEEEKELARKGIKYLQAANTQRLPKIHEHKAKIKRNRLGNKNSFGQKYLVRNAYFEPFSDLNKDWVNSCMKEIETAFLWKKPAVIQMHRVNFIGSLNPSNRERNLKLFSQLIDNIIKKWPEVEFKSSDQLAKLL